MEDYRQYLQELLLATAQQGASDLHLSPGHYPTLRVDNHLVALTDKNILDKETLEGIVFTMLGEHKDRFLTEHELNFSYELDQKARFRVSAYHTNGNVAATLRFIPDEIRTIEELNLPPVIKVFTKLSQGLVLVVGPSGQGKSTTLAAILNLINRERSEKIVTIEDPIEYVFKPEKCIVDQREINRDTNSFHNALKSTSRQDTNIIMVGDMPDYETIGATITAAEAGHLVFAPLHTNSASQTLEWIISSFPAPQQTQVRDQLANTISGIISQRLVPRIRGGLVPAVEVMIATTAIRTHIRDNRLKQLDLTIETGYDMGMISLDRSLADLVRRNEISPERAEFYAHNPETLKSLLRQS